MTPRPKPAGGRRERVGIWGMTAGDRVQHFYERVDPADGGSWVAQPHSTWPGGARPYWINECDVQMSSGPKCRRCLRIVCVLPARRTKGGRK